MAWTIDRAKSFGPTGIVGPGKWIGGGNTKAQWATRMLRGVSHYIPIISLIFFRVGLTSLLASVGGVAVCGASYEIALSHMR